MENTGGSRAGYTELGQLVQQRAFARADRAHPASGGGKRLLSANGRSGQSGLTKTKQPPENPGRFTVLAQMLKIIPRHEFDALARKHHQGRKLRKMSRWSQFVAMASAQLCGRVSLRDLISNLEAQLTKLYHLGLRRVTRSSLARVNKNRPIRCTKRCFISCWAAASGWRQATVFVSRTSFTHSMPQRSTCA